MSQPKVIEQDAVFKIKNQKSEKWRVWRKEIVGAPVMIRLIADAMARVFA